jgi:alpha-mannosidase
MKYYFVTVLIVLSNILYAATPRVNKFPEGIEYRVQPFYRFRPDGKPGREVILKLKGPKISGKAKLEVIFCDIHEVTELNPEREGMDSIVVLLPADIGVKQDAQVSIGLSQGSKKLNKMIEIPALRHWTVYVYPHSHVDIGYSNTQANVEFIHKRNIDQGILLAEKTRNYPEGSRYVWNTEVMWPLERYMNTATPEKKNFILDAVKKGQLCPDASYVHVNTSTCNDEELFQLVRSRSEIERLTGKPVDVMVQVDLPGISWGVVPVLAHEGIKYLMVFPNDIRANPKMTTTLNQKPFWWVAQDGESKVLFLQPGSYAVGTGKGKTTGRPWFGQQDTAKIPLVIKTGNPRENFLDKHLFYALPSLELAHHPYDIYVVTWAMWDNALLDADLPNAVSSWNKEYAYPRLIISGAHNIMKAFEEKYGDKLPEVKGDYTEYWTDNMGVAARENKMNRNAKERLLQAETAWTMLRPGKPAPRKEFDEAWRNIILSSEHTYASENPMDPFFFNAIWKVKQSYFREAEDRSITMLDCALAPATDKSDGGLGPVEGPSNGGVAVINTHSWEHGGLVTLNKLESQKGDRVVDDQGKEVLSQRVGTGELIFLASEVPAFGSRHYRVVPGKCTIQGSCKFDDHVIENDLLKVELDKNTGNITGLIEVSSGRNLADKMNGGGLNTLHWQPARGKGSAKPDRNIVISIKESGPLFVEAEVSSQADGCRFVVRRVRLVHGQPWIEISNTVDKLPLPEKDGIHFGFNFNIPGSTTRVDIPWNIMRMEEDQWAAANRAWMATQRWVDISNDKQGVTWCSLDAPLIESGSITANNTAGGDGKGDVWPDELLPSSTIYSWVMNNHWFTNTPLTQDGPVTFRYRIMPHGIYDASAANRFGLEQSQPLLHVLCDKNPIEFPIVSIDNTRVFITLLKSVAEGGSTILRLRSLSDKNEYINLEWPSAKPKSLFLCDKGEEAGNTEVSKRVIVPAMGLVTLRAEW